MQARRGELMEQQASLSFSWLAGPPLLLARGKEAVMRPWHSELRADPAKEPRQTPDTRSSHFLFAG